MEEEARQPRHDASPVGRTYGRSSDLRGSGYRSFRRTCWLLGFVVDVHRLYADAARAGHFRQAHGGAAEKSGAEFLELHIHRDGGILIQERAGFHHDALAGTQPAFENIAVARSEEHTSELQSLRH